MYATELTVAAPSVPGLNGFSRFQVITSNMDRSPSEIPNPLRVSLLDGLSQPSLPQRASAPPNLPFVATKGDPGQKKTSAGFSSLVSGNAVEPNKRQGGLLDGFDGDLDVS
jgi:hypothetical protein